MESGIYLNESVWSIPLVEYNIKQNRRVMDLRIRSSIAITKLPLRHDILTKKKSNSNNKKEKCDFFSGFF